MLILVSNTPDQKPKTNPLWAKIEQLSLEIEAKAVAWRRNIHQHPELGYQEFRTAKFVADHLKNLGMQVRTGVAQTGVVGILRGERDAPVAALRADMDAVTVTEAVDVPFKSKIKTMYMGKEVGVMHACGHDVHTAVLMAVAEVLSKVKDELPGTVKFIFQPAEEITPIPKGERGGGSSLFKEPGASLMIKEGVLESPRPDAIFALHVGVSYPVGAILYRSGGILSYVDVLEIIIKGSQTAAGAPWNGIDPFVVASQVILGLQTIVSRQTNLLLGPAVISFGVIQGGHDFGTIPDKVEMVGTIRGFDPKIRKEMHERIQRTTKMIAESAGATAEIKIDKLLPVTFNDPNLTKQMIPTLERVAGKQNLSVLPQGTYGEDFSFYQEKIPGLYFAIGNIPPGGKIIPNHSPYYYVDEKAILVGIRAMTNLAVDFLSGK
jgi:amidohydrolase